MPIDPTKIDPKRIPDDAWEFEGMADGGLARTYIYWIDKETGTFVRKKEQLIEKELLDMNKHQMDESQTKRFGDGYVTARMPLNVYFRDIAPRLKEGDDDYLKWWLNHEENRPFRTFRGKH